MLALVLRRLLSAIPLLFLVSLIVFALIELVPGDPAITLAGENATEERINEVRENLGLNDPIIPRYFDWVSDAIRGDFGTSLFSNIEVTDRIGQVFPATMSLTLGAIVFAIVVGVPVGILAAARRGKLVDRVVMLAATSGIALPSYVLGMLLILFFALHRGWFPATGYVGLSVDFGDWLKSITLPSIALGTNGAAVVARQLRSSLIDVFQQDYVRTARAKGLRTRVVILKHALKNAAVPVVTVLGLQISFLLGGTVIIENVFGINGLGQLVISSVFQSDLPMIQGIVVVTTLIVVVVNLLVDLAYGFLNPRARTQ